MCRGIVIKAGSYVGVFSLTEIRRRKIRLRKTDIIVVIDGDFKHVYEKADWDECPKIDQMWDNIMPQQYKLNDVSLESIIQRDLMGLNL